MSAEVLEETPNEMSQDTSDEMSEEASRERPQETPEATSPETTGTTSHETVSTLEERRAAILALLEQESSVRVSQLAQTFGISYVTVRSDLDALERDGKLRRTHGGAVSLSRQLTVSVQERRVNVNVAAKRAIATAAARFVVDGDSLLLDSGTTALEFARALSTRSALTIVTADLTIAEYVDRSMPGCDVVLSGGLLRKAHRYMSGPLALNALASLHVSKAFLCPGAYIPGRGFMTDYQSMAQLKRALLDAADESYCLMDKSKIGARGLLRFADVGDFRTIVMDEDPEGIMTAALEGVPTHLLIA